jgi:hypothetical protein
MRKFIRFQNLSFPISSMSFNKFPNAKRATHTINTEAFSNKIKFLNEENSEIYLKFLKCPLSNSKLEYNKKQNALKTPNNVFSIKKTSFFNI